MGYLFYGNTPCPIVVPDRVLAHVKVVIATKLRRSESFTLSWQHPEGAARGRSTIWIHAAIPLRFVFDTADAEMLDREYLHELALAAGSSGGMKIDVQVVEERIVSDHERAQPGRDLATAH